MRLCNFHLLLITLRLIYLYLLLMWMQSLRIVMIGSGIEVALKSFSKDVPTQKAIVVVSDGENTEGDVMSAVEDSKKAGVRVYSVGMGTPEGAPIPVLNQNGVRVDYKRDQSGSIVLSKLDETMLQQIASTTGGSYHRAQSGGNEIDDIFKELASLQKWNLEQSK